MNPEESPNLELPQTFDATPDPERIAMARELGALVESAIDRLPDGTREVFMLRQVEGMSTDEVADALNISEAVVKTRLWRARGARRRDLFERPNRQPGDGTLCRSQGGEPGTRAAARAED
jgi:RNA polymerase sigma-70 factor (ECF subfamily)